MIYYNDSKRKENLIYRDASGDVCVAKLHDNVVKIQCMTVNRSKYATICGTKRTIRSIR